MVETAEADVDLAKLVDSALSSVQLAPALLESGLVRDDIVTRIRPRLRDVLAVAEEERVVLRHAETALQNALSERSSRLQRLARRARYVLAPAILAGWLLTASVVAFGLAWVWTRALEFRLAFPWGGWIVVASSILVSTIATVVATKRTWARLSSRRLRRVDEILQIPQLEKQVSTLKSQYLEVIFQKAVVPEVTGILSVATKASYDTVLASNVTGIGLSEVFTSALEVQTSGRTKLVELMKQAGGSIGLAGPRGAGKTTLMMLLGNREPCFIYCPAPVEYSGRDFLVTLFLLLCNKVLQHKKPSERADEDYVESLGEGRPRTSPWVWALFAAFRLPTLMLLAYLGILLLGGGLWMVVQQMRAGSSTAAASAVRPSSSTSLIRNAEAGTMLERFLDALGIEPRTLVRWGAYLVLALVVLLIIMRSFRLAARNGSRRIKFGLSSTEGTVADIAKQHLSSLRFQQSYTSGWSGTLKLPFGVEGGVNDARTLARNQRSLPELVQDFREFLRLVTAEFGRVIIAIDELDKLESDEKAHLFLNEIKAIFAVPNVYYLVSVSENAISAFERRGLPFRDVFDSSFDTIVHVNYLSLVESKRLLKRRTTRVAEPFLCVCHCLAGGLPRDLIRTCREMLEVAKREKVYELRSLAHRLITLELQSKARAMSIAAARLPGPVAPTQFLSLLNDLIATNDNEQHLLARACQLLNVSDAMRTIRSSKHNKPDGLAFDPASVAALADLEAEFGLYLAYVATVLEIVGVASAENWQAYEQDGRTETNRFDELASIRQTLAVSAAVGRERLVKFRSHYGLVAGLSV